MLFENLFSGDAGIEHGRESDHTHEVVKNEDLPPLTDT